MATSDEIKEQRPDALSDEVSAAAVGRAGTFLLDCEVTMVSCVYWHNEPLWILPRRTVVDTLLLCPVRGRYQVTLDDFAGEVAPGEFLLLPEGTPHAIRQLDTGEVLEQFSLHCYVYNAWRMPLVKMFASPIQRFPDAMGGAWEHELRQLTSMMGQDAIIGQAAGEVFMKRLLASLVLSGAEVTAASARPDPRIAGALATIHLKFGAGLSVARLAGESRLSEVQFRKLFRRDTGESPKGYIARYRLKVATELLRQSRLSVKEVSREAGFSSDYYFHSAFKKAFGCTPSAYRKHGHETV